MKKILVILLVFFLSVQPVNAKDTSFELTDERGMKGETITVKLEINDNALVHFADVINNDGTLEEFEDKLDKFINKELQIIRRERENEGR